MPCPKCGLGFEWTAFYCAKCDSPVGVLAWQYTVRYYIGKGNYGISKAEAFLLEVIKVFKEIWGEEHSEMCKVLERLSGLYRKSGRDDEAIELEKRVEIIQNRKRKLNDIKTKKKEKTGIELQCDQCLAVFCVDKGDISRAICPTCKKALNLRACAHSYYAKGYISFQEGNYDKAILNYTKAKLLDPAFAPIHYNIGSCYFEKGEYSEALNYYSKAVALDPKHYEAYLGCGFIYDKRNDYDKAVSNYECFLTFAPFKIYFSRRGFGVRKRINDLRNCCRSTRGN